MPELPKPMTWILSPSRTFANVEQLARAEAAANGWAVKVEPVVVDGQDAALVIFSKKAVAESANLALEASPPSLAVATPPSSASAWEDLLRAYQGYPDVSTDLKVASLAQWILESGRGTSVLARDHLNFAGLKFRARMSGHAEPVDYRGSDGDLATYCKFSSVGAFIAGYWHFIESGPYDGWKTYRNDGAGYIRHIAKQGYAPSADYPAKVLALFGEAAKLLSAPPSPEASGVAAPASDATGSLLRLAIVVGHNKSAKGAGSVPPISRFEYDFNSIVAAEMTEESGHYNLQAKVFFREPGSSYTAEIAKAYQAVASWGAQCVVELHFNSAGATASGSEVLCRQGSPDARALASNVAEEIQAALGLGLRHNGTGVKIVGSGERGAGSLYALDGVPIVIVEPFFGSNPAECLKVATLGEQVLALAYLRGVRDWAVSRIPAAEAAIS
ncbi:hypothetical protein GGE65_007418 [Skermanella aerolata]|uniref:N-acetylmuramoyl-L-alanine amidase n=1 Tax=Skermanella aerolata TaxID=393310 RepID=UPI003D1EC639